MRWSVVAVVAVMTVLGPVVGEAAGASWSVQSTPDPSGAAASRLAATSCVAANACEAVGYYTTSGGAAVSYAERFDGYAWIVQAMPSPAGATSRGLAGVSCTAANACTAVGTYRSGAGKSLALVERWNGTAWAVQTAANPAGATSASMSAVSCAGSKSCVSVGSYRDGSGTNLPLAETWNGSTWAVVPAPIPAGGKASSLQGVSCIATAACTAVGSYTNSTSTSLPLAESWNGTAWTLRTAATPQGAKGTFLNAASCTAASACTAVGVYTNNAGTNVTLVERWNGTAWTVEATPNPSGATSSVLNGVSCVAATACSAVGDVMEAGANVAVVETWNGARWTIQTTPTPPGSIASILNGISCTTTVACVAAGTQRNDAGAYVTLAEGFAPAWSVQSTLNPPSTRSQLKSVSCTAANACTAVGQYHDVASDTFGLVERWDGTSWTIENTPDPDATGQRQNALSGVSCTASDRCFAVGTYADYYHQYIMLVESWNGSSWTVGSASPPTGAKATTLTGISCTTSNACTAVGQYHDGVRWRTLVERWDGATWTAQAGQDPAGSTSAGLVGISCPTSSSCTAVGSYTSANTGRDYALVESWNGSSWTIAPTPTPSGAASTSLTSASCTAANACAAVGVADDGSGNFAPLVERWDGSHWTAQTVPSPTGVSASLWGVSCTAASACTAVGYYQNATTLAASWDGSAWTFQSTPALSHDMTLLGVSCTAASACQAVGYNGDLALPESWDGSRWSPRRIAYPVGAGGPAFNGVACAAGNACEAVGHGIDGSQSTTALAERWNGSNWAVQTTPAPANKAAYLEGIACSASSACTAVGGASVRNGPSSTLAERWNGSAWKIQATPTLSADGVLYGVSCPSSTACIAVGAAGDEAANSATPLVERWNGSSWSTQPTPIPGAAKSAVLTSVSCTTANACTAVGHYVTNAKTSFTLAERWNGSSWTIQTTPSPSTTDSRLHGVSCTGSNACIAAGSYVDSTGHTVTLAEAWDGVHWTRQTTPNASGNSNQLGSISCTAANACTAVGSHGDTQASTSATLAERWDGSRWTIQPTAEPPGDSYSLLAGVSCTTSVTCTAVGFYTYATGVYGDNAVVTLAEGFS